MGNYYIKATWNEIKKKKLNYALGCAAVFVVVTSVAVLLSVLSRSPVMMLRIAEIDRGERDLVIEPAKKAEANFLNFTKVRMVLSDTGQKDAIPTPRSIRWAEVYPNRPCENTYTLPSYTGQIVKSKFFSRLFFSGDNIFNFPGWIPKRVRRIPMDTDVRV